MFPLSRCFFDKILIKTLDLLAYDAIFERRLTQCAAFMSKNNGEMVWVAVIGGWMTTVFEVVVTTNLVDLARLTGGAYSTLRRRADEGEMPFFLKRKADGLMWTVKRVPLVRVGGRGGRRVVIGKTENL